MEANNKRFHSMDGRGLPPYRNKPELEKLFECSTGTPSFHKLVPKQFYTRRLSEEESETDIDYLLINEHRHLTAECRKLRKRRDRNRSNVTNPNTTEIDEEEQEKLEQLRLEDEVDRLGKTALWLRPFSMLFSLIYKLLGNYNITCSWMKKSDKKQPSNAVKALKQNLSGLFMGLLLGFASYLVFLLTFSHNPRLSTLLSAYLMLASVYGIAFSSDFRCVTLLTLPYLAASRVRWLLMLYASSITVAGPGLNFLHNSGNFRNAIACILSQVSTNLQLIQKLTAAPFGLLKNQLATMVASLNAALHKMRLSLLSINLALFKVTNVMQHQSSWIRSLVTACGDQVALQNQCLAFFNNIYFNCKASFGAFGFVCGMIRHFAADTCSSVEGLNSLCEKQAELLDDQLNITSKENLTRQMDAVLDLLGRDNLSLVGNFDALGGVDLESDDSVVSIVRERMDSFVATVEHGKEVLAWILVIWTLITMAQLIVQAALFKRSWLLSDTFDNVYITGPFAEQEARALEQGLVTTAPLIRGEKRDYKKLSNFLWATSEKRKALRSLIILFLWMISLIIVLFSDYAMYEVLITISPVFSPQFSSFGAGNQAGKDFEPTESKQDQVLIEGDSSYANIIRAFVGMLNPIKDIALDVDATACKPTATPPDSSTNNLVIAMLCLTVLSIFFEVYILRVRHVIMIWYYPVRAVQRAAWLRTHIRNNRGLFHRLVHKFFAVDVKPLRTAPKVSRLGKFLSNRPRIRRLLETIGIRRIMCAYCGEEGNPSKKAEFEEKFLQCVECGAYFCKMCQVDLDNICMICRTPLFALAVEIDFEKLSSDEEYEAICARYLRRAEQATVREKVSTHSESDDE